MGDIDYSKSQLLPIERLFNANLSFEIADYQRGYRWTNIQVEDLLDDVLEFHNRTYFDENTAEKYILQPVVVDNLTKPIQVIDGQQRLTTIFLIFNYLNKPGLYDIKYQSRDGSDDYLKKNITDSLGEKDNCIDYYYMYGVKVAIKDWFERTFNGNPNTTYAKRYIDTFLKKVHIVWEPIEEGEDHTDVFTRINGGQIPLLDSELIKAMLLDNSKYTDDVSMAEAHQLEIATYWESIENKLQDDEFWSFICNKSLFSKYEAGSPRIDYFLEIITKNNSLGLDDESFQVFMEKDNNGNEGKYYKDEHRIFRYFDKKFKSIDDSESLMECWKVIKDIYMVLVEWYQDCKLFHYIGYLILTSEDEAVDEIGTLLEEYHNKEKYKFVEFVHKRISGVIASKKWLFDKTTKDFNWDYEYDETADGDSQRTKSECVEILLLHNIETIVRQNDFLIKDEKYNLPNFTRFELHLYKKNSWQVEHIRPNAGDKFDTVNDKQLYIKTALPYLKEYSDYKRIIEDASYSDSTKKAELGKINTKQSGLYNRIYEYLKRSPEKRTNKNDDNEFNIIRALIDENIEANSIQLQNEEKNKIWNFVLLNSTDNQEYGNKIFPVKRYFLSYKEQGIKIKVNDLAELMLGLVTMDNLKTNNKVESVISFVPPITRNVFAKIYTKYPHNMTSWTYEDAEAYLNNMKDVLNDFIEEAKTLI